MDAVVLVVITTAFIIRTVGAAQGTWFNDDWGILYSLSHRPFTIGTPFVVYGGGHLQPVLFVLMWALQAATPGAYAVAVVLAGCLGAVATLLVYAVLRRLFGAQPLVVLIVVWFALTPLTLTSSMWPAVAFYLLPFEIAFAASILFLVRYLERPSAGRVVAVVAAVGAGLLSFQKILIVPLVLFALAAWFPIVSSNPPGARRALGEHQRLWWPLGVLVAGYAALYVGLIAAGHATPSMFSGFGFSAGELLRLVGNVVVVVFGTNLFGGPWQWTTGYAEAAAAPPPILVIASVLAVAALVVWSCSRRRMARRAWLLLAACLAVDVVLLAYSRLAQWGPFVGRYHHFVADVAIPAVLAVAFALLPTRAETRGLSGSASRKSRRSAASPRLAVVLAIGVALVGSTALSYGGVLDAWASNPAKPWAANARRGFGDVRASGLLTQDVPPEVLPAIFAPWNTTEVMLSIYPRHPEFRTSVDRLFALDQKGRIRPAEIRGWTSAPGPVASCGWSITAPGGSVELGSAPYPWPWYLQLTYDTSTSFVGQVAFGEASQTVRFETGHHDVFLHLVGGGASITVTRVPPDVQLCITRAVVGDLDFGE